MVFKDISGQDLFSTAGLQTKHIASVKDRLLAAMLDVLIFSPILTLFASYSLKDIRTYLMVDPGSPEALGGWVLFIFVIVSASALIQSAYIYFKGATPGQKFLLLKTVSLKGKITPGQALLRSIAFWTNFAFLGIPFLEVFTHPIRRMLHERISDTMVVSLRADSDPGPTVHEYRFFNIWIRAFSVFAFFYLCSQMFTLRQEIYDGYYTRANHIQKGEACEKIGDGENGLERIDRAVASYMAELVDAECLIKEADLALWGLDKATHGFAYLAKYITSEDELVAVEYLKLVCEDEAAKEACEIANFYHGKQKDEGLLSRKAQPSSKTLKIVMTKQFIKKAKYSAAVSLLEELQKEQVYWEFVEKNYVHSMWMINENLKGSVKSSSSGRMPTSVRKGSAEEQKLMDNFKSKYGLP